MKLSIAPGTINHFNHPSYNSYYSQYSTTYQPDNFRCRPSFRGKNAYNPNAYRHERYRSSRSNEERDKILAALGQTDWDYLSDRDLWNEAWDKATDMMTECWEYECIPGVKTPIDNFETERDGCRFRQVNRRILVGQQFCRPKNPRCKSIIVGIPDIQELPPIYGDWIDDPDCGNCPPSIFNADTFMSKVNQAIKDADFGGDCAGQVFMRFYIPIPSDPRSVQAFDGKEPYPGSRMGYLNEVSNKGGDCRVVGCYPTGCGDGYLINNIIYGGTSTTFNIGNGTMLFEFAYLEICVITEEITATGDEEKYPVRRGYLTDAFMFTFVYTFTGKFSQTPIKPFKGSCLFQFSVSKVCPPVAGGEPNSYNREGGGGGLTRPQNPRKPRNKDDRPDCMEACTCEQVEKIVAKYTCQPLNGDYTIKGCAEQGDNRFEWNGKGFEAINSALINLGASLQVISTNLCNVLTPKIDGKFDYFECTGGTNSVNYSGAGLSGLSSQVQALGFAMKKLAEGNCDKLIDIHTDVKSLPEKIQIQLSDDFALINEKLNKILDKLGKDDEKSLLERIIEIITLIATLLGLLTDIKSLLENQPDYKPDLDLLKELSQEIKRLLSTNFQGAIDAIRCDGTITKNSWSGEGLEALNQAITVLGINAAILHSDICELLERNQQVANPRLQGSIDAITCDGEIISNSWDGQGFEGLNQAITAIGVNLATLHADLCELVDRNAEIEYPTVEGSLEATKCDDTVIKTTWNGKGFEGLNEGIKALGKNLEILHQDLCQIIPEGEKVEINDQYECGDKEIKVNKKFDKTYFGEEIKFLHERLKQIEQLVCDLDDCNAVPVFPGDTIEEREIPAQAVITFVESRYYPKLTGSKWHLSIPYPVDDLIGDRNCWSKFENLVITKGEVYGRVVWRSPNDTINRFITGIYGNSQNATKQFLEEIAKFSSLRLDTIRINTGANPRARPRNVTIRAVKVVVLERDSQGRMVPTKCCRAKK